MYTLEKHLHQISIENPQFEVLDSMWKLNKNFIPNAQSAIGFNFPHYSMHESSHSETIIKNIESFLGEERIRQLSPTDTWLILMAAFTHDLGMIVFYETLEKKWEESEFQKYLIKTSENTRDKDLQKSAKLLLSIRNLADYDKDQNMNLPLEVRNAVILVTADFFRRNHHFRSKDIINGTDQAFAKLINNFNLNGVPNRFGNILGEIAYAHGIEFYDVIDRLEYCADGYGSDKMHPRFIACLLRLGDLLDVDDKRFNVFYEKVFTNKMPSTSNTHKEKHAAVKHLLISPSSIEATVDCQNDDTYRVAREWFDFLQKEVENQSKEWAGIAPQKLKGMPPAISRGKIKILYQSAEPKPELLNLRFAISSEKVFEMFEGSAIYDDADFVFLREIVQNAVDATKLRLWYDIKSGVYNYILRKHLNIQDYSQDILDQIIFPTDLPDEIWENYQIQLKIYWKKIDSILTIEIIDNGTGISEKDLIRMTHKVGESRNNDNIYQEAKKQMPYWLRPTGAFGIGLQSLFLINNTFTVHTKCEKEDAKEIIFYSAKNGDYSRITNFTPDIKRGTKILIDIAKEIFDNYNYDFRFMTGLNLFYDPFSLKYEHVFFNRLTSYLKSEFKYIKNLSITLFDDQIKKTEHTQSEKNAFVPSKKDDNKLLITLKKQNNQLEFIVYENDGIGSTLTITFTNKFKLHNNENFEYLVRDIPVGNQRLFYPHIIPVGNSKYYKLRWNFQSQESDKILNISRDKFIDKTKRKFEEILNNLLLKNILTLIVQLIEETHNKNENIQESDAIEYFHAKLLAQSYGSTITTSNSIYQDFSFPIFLVTTQDLKPFKIKDFLSQKEFIIFEYLTLNEEENDESNIERQMSLYKKAAPASNNTPIIWDRDYFSDYFRKSDFKRIAQESFITENEIINLIKISLDHETIPTISLSTTTLSLALLNVHTHSTYQEHRETFLPITKYNNGLVVSGEKEGLYRPWLCKSFIVSPFNNIEQYLTIKRDIESNGDYNDNKFIEEHIKNQYIEKLIPIQLSDWVIKNSISNNKSSLTREQILQDYTTLITDIIQEDIKTTAPLSTYLHNGDDLEYVSLV